MFIITGDATTYEGQNWGYCLEPGDCTCSSDTPDQAAYPPHDPAAEPPCTRRCTLPGPYPRPPCDWKCDQPLCAGIYS